MTTSKSDGPRLSEDVNRRKVEIEAQLLDAMPIIVQRRRYKRRVRNLAIVMCFIFAGTAMLPNSFRFQREVAKLRPSELTGETVRRKGKSEQQGDATAHIVNSEKVIRKTQLIFQRIGDQELLGELTNLGVHYSIGLVDHEPVLFTQERNNPSKVALIHLDVSAESTSSQ
ncbi:hypothetical protein [Bremerella sp. P1]|uniref:hypothetical protein n=1 Tax=Bremerella sp. P1 TaxID=3026424 RepID=UPI0023681E8E|nr:hypothetical protein [Bremerella sp. P1]WDI43751.1 hypothetical protein PSR63_07295 [Bremerella sp. P1]